MSVISFPYNNGPAEGSSQDVSAFAGAARMSKRRRLDSGDALEDYGHGGWEQQTQQQQYSGQDISRASSSFPGSTIGNSEYTGALSTHENAASSALNDTSDRSQPQWHSSGTSPYPDVASYSQQPYFFQQTDPSAYNSTWPPPESGSLASQAIDYSVPAHAMPFFPPKSNAESNNNTFEATGPPSFQEDYSQDIEPTQPYPYTSKHSQQRSDAPDPPPTVYSEDASMHLKIQSLPILENLATQLIHTIAKATFPQIQEIMRSKENEDSQAYTTLKSLFDQTRKVYSRDTPFIDAIAIQMFQPSQQETIRKANIATFISSILGAHDVSFFHLNEFFMETFVPLGHRLLKWQGAIYLDLKTQSYISALINSDGGPEAMLDELFPPDLDAQILTRHPDAPSLSPSEQDFIDRSRARKSYLLAEDNTDEALRELPKKYQWSDFVREFATCISKNVDGIMNVPARSQPVFGSGGGDRRTASSNAALQATLGRSSSLNSGANSTGGSLGLGESGGQTNSNQSGQRESNETSKKSAAAASTIRQPWTKPEEDALLSGLERVNGPHWSQILAFYGRGGSISEVLKDRNQVQLKDKARNLKLWYLKMGKDVPPALRGVTGELRKRGGARARAALGIADEDEGDPDQMDADGEVEGEGIDPALERSQSRAKGGRKNKK